MSLSPNITRTSSPHQMANDTRIGSGRAPASANIYANLQDKYQSVAAQVSELRSSNNRLTSSIAQIQQEQEQLQVWEEKLQKELATAGKTRLTIVGNPDDSDDENKVDSLARAEQKYQQAIDQRRSATLALEKTQREYDAFQQEKDQERQSFWAESREFQVLSQQLQLQAQVLDLPHASAHAFVAVHGDPTDTEAMDAFACIDPGPAKDKDSDEEVRQSNADPITWKDLYPSDDEFQEALAVYQKDHEALTKAQAKLDETTKETEKLMQVQNQSNKHQEQLQRQLDRIEQESAELERQIEDTKRKTQEFQQGETRSPTTTAYSSVTPSPNTQFTSTHSRPPTQVLHNPYAKTAKRPRVAFGDGNEECNTARPRSLVTASPNVDVPSYTSMRNHQQPHRMTGSTRRDRRNRQFGSNLFVSGGEHSPMQKDMETGLTDTDEPNGIQTPSPTVPDITSLLEDDDDDDDDDELLNVHIFSKKTI